jgi:murein DD-endopeptidase MepM/ murein hydrolase activator NlpD
MHYGIDLGAKEGTPIYAVRSGKVKTATYDSSAGYYVDIDHQDGFLTRYFHMTHYVVKKGDTVKAGQVIGYVGSTGTSTGPHLHFGMKYNGSYVNPAKYIKF